MTERLTARRAALRPATRDHTATSPDADGARPTARALAGRLARRVTRRPDRPPSGAAGTGPSRRERWGLAGIVLLLFAAYTTYAWARHAKYETTGFDLGIFDQVVRAYAHFDAPTSPLKGIGYDRYTMCEVGKKYTPEEGLKFLKEYKKLWDELAGA